MRVHRVHVSPLREGVVTLVGPEARHLAGVLRVAPGQKVRAFDGKGWEAEGEVQTADPLRVTVKDSRPPSKAKPKHVLAVTLAVALLKGDKLSDVVRQGTELGAVRFLLFTSRHGDVPSLVAEQARAPAPRRQGSRQAVGPERGADGRAAYAACSSCRWTAPVLVAHPHASLTLKDVSRRILRLERHRRHRPRRRA